MKYEGDKIFSCKEASHILIVLFYGLSSKQDGSAGNPYWSQALKHDWRQLHSEFTPKQRQ